MVMKMFVLSVCLLVLLFVLVVLFVSRPSLSVVFLFCLGFRSVLACFLSSYSLSVCTFGIQCPFFNYFSDNTHHL